MVSGQILGTESRLNILHSKRPDFIRHIHAGFYTELSENAAGKEQYYKEKR
jgi:hypothetical protein